MTRVGGRAERLAQVEWQRVPAHRRPSVPSRKRILKRKDKGETIKVPEEEEEEETPSPVGDLMAALEESLARVKDGAAAG